MEFERSAERGKGWCCSQVALQLPAGARRGRFRILSSGRKLQKAKHLAKALTESGGGNGTRGVQGALRYWVYLRQAGWSAVPKVGHSGGVIEVRVAQY